MLPSWRARPVSPPEPWQWARGRPICSQDTWASCSCRSAFETGGFGVSIGRMTQTLLFVFWQSDQQLDCALDLMRRLPPQQIEKNLSDLIDLVGALFVWFPLGLGPY